MNELQILWVGLAGGAGAALRVYTSAALESRWGSTGWGLYFGGHLGTLCVNLLGCLLLGALSQLFSGNARILVVGGFLGGLTTFGTFSAILLEHAEGSNFATLCLQVSAHLVGGVMAVWAGRELLLLVSGR